MPNRNNLYSFNMVSFLRLFFTQMKTILGLLKKKHTRRLLRHHVSHLALSSPNKNRIVFCCNGVVAHGGLVDRFKGIISMYDAAIRLNAEFYIDSSYPFPLDDFLMPNQVKWVNNRIGFNPFRDRIIHKVSHRKSGVLDPVKLFDLEKPRTYFVYVNFNYLENVYPEKKWHEITALMRTYFDRLFQFSPKLEEAMRQLPQESRIVCHARFGGILGDFHDVRNDHLSNEVSAILFEQLKRELTRIQAAHRQQACYVLSDSPIFLAYVDRLGGFKTLPGIPKHIDVKGEENNWIDFQKTFTDFFFMVQSKHVYTLCAKPLYPSTYCTFAALLGNIPTHAVKQFDAG